MKTALFDYDLPDDRIALRPVEPRDAARLLVVRPEAGRQDRIIRDLPDLLRAGDALVLNDTRVIPAALSGTRVRGEVRAAVAATLIERLDQSRWRAFARPAKRLAAGDRISFGAVPGACLLGSLDATVLAKREEGEIELGFDLSGVFLGEAIAAAGAMPLPPYIAARRAPDDQDRKSYQTIFAARDGAVAAPTAGLHFTKALLDALVQRGISIHFVTLHTGAGTFLPVKTDDAADHIMHAERGMVSGETALALNEARARGGRIVAVGTTSLRLLESAARSDGTLEPLSGKTRLFITPGYQFRAVDLLLTNFHLPRSTLLMLVSAFSGLDTVKAAYAHAIRSGYRFYSYGDACLLHPCPAALAARINPAKEP